MQDTLKKIKFNGVRGHNSLKCRVSAMGYSQSNCKKIVVGFYGLHLGS